MVKAPVDNFANRGSVLSFSGLGFPGRQGVFDVAVLPVQKSLGLSLGAAGEEHEDGEGHVPAGLGEKILDLPIPGAGDLGYDALGPLHQLLIAQAEVHHQVGVDLAAFHHDPGGEHIEHQLLNGSRLHAGGARDGLRQ